MRNQNTTRIAKSNLALLGAGLVAIAGAGAFAADPQEQPETYTWSAELIALDRAANTVTVKARLVETADTKLELRAGDKAMLTWSGISMAAGIRAIEPGSDSSYDRMTMPIEYVGSELDGRYVSFKVPVPAADAAKLAALSPGQWVTATSPHQPKSSTEAVRSIRPYNDVG